MSTVIEKFDTIASLIVQTNQQELIKTEFLITRSVTIEGFSKLAEQAETTSNLLQKQDHEKLKSNIKQWKNTLNDRKKYYWLYFKNSKLEEKYNEWYNAAPIKLPNKFLPKIINGEPEEHREIRMRKAKDTMKYEIEMMKAKINNFKSKFEVIGQTIFSEIETSSSHNSSKSILKQLWIKDCKSEELISEKSWKEKEEWLINLEFQADQGENSNKRQSAQESGYNNRSFQRGNEDTYPQRLNNALRNDKNYTRTERERGRHYYNERNQRNFPYNDGNGETETRLQRSNSFLYKGQNQTPRF